MGVSSKSMCCITCIPGGIEAKVRVASRNARKLVGPPFQLVRGPELRRRVELVRKAQRFVSEPPELASLTMDRPSESNPLSALVLGFQEEIAQLKDEIRKRDSVSGLSVCLA